MQTQSIILSLYQIGAIQFGEFTLKNNATSPIYINLRKIISYPPLFKETAHLMYEAIRHMNVDLICGVPYAGLPIASAISVLHGIPMIMRRKERKEYGLKKMIEGEYQQGQRVIIVEDVITTGSSIIETAQGLQQEGLTVEAAVAFICREREALNNLKDYHPHPVFTLPEILTTLLNSNVNSYEERVIMEKFMEQMA